jgi:transposase InsO family protein
MMPPRKEGGIMPLQERGIMELRQEFVMLAAQEGANMRELCRRYGISPTTGYGYLARWRAEGVAGLRDRSRRPHASPRSTTPAVEAAVLALRDAHPAWGGRKLHHALARQGVVQPLPAPSTITAILRRHDRLAEPVRPQHALQRFAAEAANDLWQLDFMGQPALPGGHVFPLTLLDDHSRFALAVVACAHQQSALVREHLAQAFRRYGLPRRILTDNGPPWGTAGAGGITALEAWWLQLGIAVSHGRPRHPQTQGKLERLHRTLWAETVGIRDLPDLATAQTRFDAVRQVYNHERPHAALGYAVPAHRYQLSPRAFPETAPELVYPPGDAVRKVQTDGTISWRNRDAFISYGLAGRQVGVRPTTHDGVCTVWYGHRQVATIDLTERS